VTWRREILTLPFDLAVKALHVLCGIVYRVGGAEHKLAMEHR
jgi:hypothetical protein